jgi:hypothetical protein
VDQLLAEGNAAMAKGYEVLQTKYIKKAVQCYGKVLKSDPQSREALLKMGEGLAVLSKLKEAFKLFDNGQKLFGRTAVPGTPGTRLAVYDFDDVNRMRRKSTVMPPRYWASLAQRKPMNGRPSAGSSE